MSEPWAKRSTETSLAFSAFCDFLQMGPARSLVECAREFDHRLHSVNTWSRRHDWFARAEAYDVQELAVAAARHERRRAEIRQKLMERGLEMAEVAMSVAAGRVTDPCICPHRKPPGGISGIELAKWAENIQPCRCGAWAPIRDREGAYIGDRPLVAPSTRYVAAVGILDRNGITVPKRVELTGADGEALQLEARALLGGLSNAALDALAAVFPESDGDDEPA